MEYLVIGPDGQEYGPATVSTLSQWARDNRLNPSTQLKEVMTGRVVPASGVPGIFPAPTQSVTPPPAVPLSNYPRFDAPPTFAAPINQAIDSKGPLWNSLWRSAAALVLFFLFHGIGLIFAGYGLAYAIKAHSNGSKYGITAICISGVTMAIIGIGWLLRLNGAGL